MPPIVATAKDLQNFLLSQTEFDKNSLPNSGIIDAAIVRAQGDFQRRTGTSFWPVLVTHETHSIKSVKAAYRELLSDSFISAVPKPVQLNHSPVCPFDSTRGHKIEVYEGADGTIDVTNPEGQWTEYVSTKTQGRDNDWWLDEMKGQIHIRKAFLARRYKTFRITYEMGKPITQLNGAITSTATTITVDSTHRYETEGYIRIGNEWIHHTGKTTTTFTGCTRGELGTDAEAHSDNDRVVEVPLDVWDLILKRAAVHYLQNEPFIGNVSESGSSDMQSKIRQWNEEWEYAMRNTFQKIRLL